MSHMCMNFTVQDANCDYKYKLEVWLNYNELNFINEASFTALHLHIFGIKNVQSHSTTRITDTAPVLCLRCVPIDTEKHASQTSKQDLKPIRHNVQIVSREAGISNSGRRDKSEHIIVVECLAGSHRNYKSRWVTSQILYSGRKPRGWRIWLTFSKGPGQASINSTSHVGWLYISLPWTSSLPPGLTWPFGKLCSPSLLTPTHTNTQPWEQFSSDFALAALACICWQKVTVKFRPDHLTGNGLGNCLKRSADTLVESAAATLKWKHYLVVRM